MSFGKKRAESVRTMLTAGLFCISCALNGSVVFSTGGVKGRLIPHVLFNRGVPELSHDVSRIEDHSRSPIPRHLPAVHTSFRRELYVLTN